MLIIFKKRLTNISSSLLFSNTCSSLFNEECSEVRIKSVIEPTLDDKYDTAGDFSL